MHGRAVSFDDSFHLDFPVIEWDGNDSWADNNPAATTKQDGGRNNGIEDYTFLLSPDGSSSPRGGFLLRSGKIRGELSSLGFESHTMS
jgi:hypothetical protein